MIIRLLFCIFVLFKTGMTNDSDRNIRTLVATLQQANSSQSESIERLTRQNEQLQNKLQELLAQVAWLNRQLFGRKSEKLAHLDPNQLSLFDPPVQPLEHEIPEEAAAPRTCLLDDSQKESASEPQHVGWPSCSGDCHRTRRSRSG